MEWLTPPDRRYLSFIPLDRWALDEPWSRSLTWAFQEGWNQVLVAPFAYFGLVAVAYYLSLSMGGLRSTSLASHLVQSCAAGVLGSLWWWTSWEPWYFSVLHGSIWGVLVGLGAWRGLADGKAGASTRFSS